MDDMKKKALKMLKEKMKGKDIKKVSVISDSKEGLEEGLSLADKLLKKKGFACGGVKKKYMNGGMEEDEKDEYKMSEGLKKEVAKLKGSEDKESYEIPDMIKNKMSDLEKAFKNRKKK